MGTTQPTGCALTPQKLFLQSTLDTANSYTCPCVCAAPGAAVCTARLAFFTDAFCTGASSNPCAVSTSCGQCTANPSNATHLKLTTWMNATCATPLPPTPPAFAPSAFECSAYASDSPVSCKNSGQCIKTFAPETKICLLRAGLVSCPSGFTSSQSYYQSVSDKRTCEGTCTCKSACKCSGQECQAEIHSDTACTSTPTVLTAGVCTQKPNTFGATFSADLTGLLQATCQPAPSPPAPESVAKGESQVTICCKP